MAARVDNWKFVVFQDKELKIPVDISEVIPKEFFGNVFFEISEHQRIANSDYLEYPKGIKAIIFQRLEDVESAIEYSLIKKLSFSVYSIIQ